MVLILIFIFFFIMGLIATAGIIDGFTDPQALSGWVEDNKSKTPEEKERDSNWSFQMVWGKCPYCWEEISRGAVRCPKCTANLDPTRNNGK